jgi:hypothetical protein
MRCVSPRQHFLRALLATVLCRTLEPAASRAPVRERLFCGAEAVVELLIAKDIVFLPIEAQRRVPEGGTLLPVV